MANAELGMKYDGDKADLTLLEGMQGALEQVARVLMFGEKKYARDSWQAVPNGRRRYKAAAMRHSLRPLGALDSESNLMHAAHEACSILFAIQLELDELNKPKEADADILQEPQPNGRSDEPWPLPGHGDGSYEVAGPTPCSSGN